MQSSCGEDTAAPIVRGSRRGENRSRGVSLGDVHSIRNDEPADKGDGLPMLDDVHSIRNGKPADKGDELPMLGDVPAFNEEARRAVLQRIAQAARPG